MIFVFGSNLAGRHGAGAALAAKNQHGAEYGVGEGPTGNSYALPTCDRRIKPLPLFSIKRHVDTFIAFAKLRPDLTFQVTRVGCGLAYYTDKDIAPLFRDAPQNCAFDTKWRPFLESPEKGFSYWGTF